MTEATDITTLVRKCQSGDRAALGALYQTFLDPMREVVAYYVRNPEAVRDILHDGFLIAFASISSLRDASKTESWLTSIMKNLALSYLRDASDHVQVPVSDQMDDDNIKDSETESDDLSWDELNVILDRLPDGYGKIFRLAVLDGLSHNEIGTMLGIAPHSSSSQLVRAKTMLRRMIRQYRIEMGMLSLLALIMLVWLIVPRHQLTGGYDAQFSDRGDSNSDLVQPAQPDRPVVADSAAAQPDAIYRVVRRPQVQHVEYVAETAAPADSIASASDDSVATAPQPQIRHYQPYRDDNIAHNVRPASRRSSDSDWALSLAYSGAAGLNNSDSYRTRNPLGTDGPGGMDDPDFPGNPDGDTEIEVNEKTRYRMPVVIGLSLNKSLTSRWSVETGLRYSFMESDCYSESKLFRQHINQQIHYIGVPLKFNYRIFSVSGFSLYGHGGGALDIPVSGRQSLWKRSGDKLTVGNDRCHIHAPVQWSVESGLGIQYHITPSISIFAEPSVHYYFNPGGKIKTIRQEKPFEFALPIGLRLTW